MLGANMRASRGLRWGLFSLATILAVTAVSTDPADARSKRKRSAGQAQAAKYNPPYAAIVVDANSNSVLHASNADSLRHPASLTKIMTLYLLFERIESGKVKLSTPFSVSAHAASQAPSKLGLPPGRTLDAEDAIKALVTKSANDAAVVVAEALGGDEDTFAEMMTRKARSLGMNRTVYKNASGLPNPDQVTTARDQALLGRAIQDRFPQYYRYFSLASFNYRGHAMRNHNKLLGRVEGVDGIKTGYTRASGFNLVSSVRRGNRHIVAVVLGGRSGGARDARMRDLIGEYIQVASVRRTTPVVAEAPAAAPTPVAAAAVPTPVSPPARFALASASNNASSNASSNVQSDPAPVAVSSAARVAPGSSEPMQPVVVKTVSVKLGAQAARVPTPAPAPQTTTGTATVTSSHLPTVRAEPAPPDARPGTLGVLRIASAAETPRMPVAEMTSSVPASAHAKGGWIIQVGAFDQEGEAKERLSSAKGQARSLLGAADPYTERVTKGDKSFFRARFAGLNKQRAEAACRTLKKNDIACMAMKN